jgi:hypothetical protein
VGWGWSFDEHIVYRMDVAMHNRFNGYMLGDGMNLAATGTHGRCPKGTVTPCALRENVALNPEESISESNSSPLMESKCPLPCSLEPATYPD